VHALRGPREAALVGKRDQVSELAEFYIGSL
jgi:hypothetical protein